MLNGLWAFMMIAGIIYGSFNGNIQAVTEAAFQSAGEAVSLCITMLGIMSFWTGILKIGERAGVIEALTRKMTPLIHFLFPELPCGHPAVGSISANLIANVLGLGWAATPAGLKAMEDLKELEEAFKNGVKLFLYSNPNNPTGAVFSKEEVSEIARLAKKYDVAILADELYSRQILEKDFTYTHMRALPEKPDKLITIMGPSKTESLSGFRLGVGYGTPEIITRMEKLQAVVSLRCAGYNQAAFYRWFSEPDGWRNVLLITDRSAMIFLLLSTAALDAGLVQQKAEAISSCSFQN